MWEALVGAVAGAVTIFGASSTGDHARMPPVRELKERATITRELRQNFEKRSSSSATSTKPLDMGCVSVAASTREIAIGSAVTKFTTDTNAAYTARASALASAYAQGSNDAIKEAVKTAWQQFATSLKATKKAWVQARDDAWKQYKTTLKTCGSGATSIGEAGNVGTEL
jgi:hypothetical protein